MLSFVPTLQVYAVFKSFLRFNTVYSSAYCIPLKPRHRKFRAADSYAKFDSDNLLQRMGGFSFISQHFKAIAEVSTLNFTASKSILVELTTPNLQIKIEPGSRITYMH